jgi:hypothetical protein
MRIRWLSEGEGATKKQKDIITSGNLSCEWCDRDGHAYGGLPARGLFRLGMRRCSTGAWQPCTPGWARLPQGKVI